MSELGMEISGTYFGTKEEFDSLNITSVFPDHTDSNVTVFNGWQGVVSNWAENVGLTLGGSIPANFYSKNLAFTKSDIIPDATVDQFFKYLDDVDKGTLIWFAIFDLEGGAINDIAMVSDSRKFYFPLFDCSGSCVNFSGILRHLDYLSHFYSSLEWEMLTVYFCRMLPLTATETLYSICRRMLLMCSVE